MTVIEILDRQLNTISKIFTAYEISWKYELNKSGSASFSMRLVDSKATPTILKFGNRVRIWKDGTKKWIGFIDSFDISENDIKINCFGMLELFKRRLYNGAISGAVGITTHTLLIYTNSIENTFINFGTEYVTDTIDMTFENTPILDAWTKMIKAVNCEMEIDLDFYMNVMQQIGSDKSSQVIFRYDEEQVELTNIYKLSSTIDGSQLVNSVSSKADIYTSIKQDASSIADYGLWQSFKNFSETSQQVTLDNETQNEVDQNKLPVNAPKITPNPLKIDTSLYDIGDTVRVVLRKGQILNIDSNFRIISKEIKITTSGFEDVNLTLSEETRNLGYDFFKDYGDIKNRLSLLERII